MIFNEVIIATKNKGKAAEFKRIFSELQIEVKTLLDFPEQIDIKETGQTFEENAIIKAKSLAKSFNKVVIADDSGLIVDALNGQPGIYSARYAGEEKDDEKNNDKILAELADVPREKRTARFYCALAIATPEGKTKTVNGICEGKILTERRGTNGFGYDPIFYVNEKKQAMAELPADIKNKISHRAQALQKLVKLIDENFAT